MSVGAVNKQTGDRIPTAGMPAIDDALDLTSVNPVQNAIITAALADKQDKTDNSLQTTDKTVVGAVNELKSGLTNYQTQNDINLEVPERKNMLPMNIAWIKAHTTGTWDGNTVTQNGVTFELVTDGDTITSVVANRVSTSSENAILNLASYKAKTGDILNGCPSGGGDSTYKIYARAGQTGNTGTDIVVNPNDVGVNRTYAIAIFSSASPSNLTFYPMIRPATITDPTFAPYIPSVESRIEVVESNLTNVTPDIKTVTASPDLNGFINLSTYGYSKNSHKYVNAVVVDNNYCIKMWKHSSYGWVVTLYTNETFTRVTDTTVSVDLVIFGIKA